MTDHGPFCCGMHEVCEKQLAPAPDPTLYFEDEELDRWHGTPATGYPPEAIGEFEEVLLTMRADEVASWLVALGKREIELPAALRDEAAMLIEEASRTAQTADTAAQAASATPSAPNPANLSA